MASDSLHEDPATLGPEVIDRHRAIVSLMEELEAVDWYDQRAKATANPELRAILEHNRDEEKEHAAMALEWLRRNDPKFDEHLKTFLFTEGPITGIEKAMTRAAKSAPRTAGADGSLGIGSLRPATGQVTTMTNHLFRDRAPITEAGWKEIEKEAKRTLRALLAARRVVDFKGPLGWGASDVELGRADPIASPPSAKSVQARLRRIQPLVELRIPFDVTRAELDAIDRGARDPDLDVGDGGGARDRHRRGSRDLPRLRRRADHRHLSGAGIGQRYRSAAAMPTIRARCRRRSPSCATTASKGRSPWC